MALLTFVPLLWSAWAAVIEGRYLPLPGLLGALGAGVTVLLHGDDLCLAEIRAGLAHAADAALLSAVFAVGRTDAGEPCRRGGRRATLALSLAAIAATLAAWSAKIVWRRRMLSLRPLSTPETATGLGAIGRVRLFERPHMNDNYLTREMGFKIARKHAGKLARIAFACGAALPVVVPARRIAFDALIPALAIILILCAAVSHGIGMLVERWLFFAEARHAVTTYY